MEAPVNQNVRRWKNLGSGRGQYLLQVKTRQEELKKQVRKTDYQNTEEVNLERPGGFFVNFWKML